MVMAKVKEPLTMLLATDDVDGVEGDCDVNDPGEYSR